MARSSPIRHGAVTAAVQPDACASARVRSRPCAYSTRITRASSGLPLSVGAIGRPPASSMVDKVEREAHRLDLRAVGRSRTDLLGVAPAAEMPVAPRHHPGGAGRLPSQPLSLGDHVQAIGDAPAARIVLAPERQHHLGDRQPARVCARQSPERRQPPLGDRVVEPIDDPLDHRCGGLKRSLRHPRAQELLDGILVVAFAHQQLGVRRANFPDPLDAAALKPFEQVLPQARVAAHRMSAVAPRDGEMVCAERREPRRRVGLAERAARDPVTSSRTEVVIRNSRSAALS